MPNKPTKLQRYLEILPGFFSWSLILFPFWGSLIIPTVVAYYIIAFDVYWLYKSISLGILAIVSFVKIKANSNYDWMGDVEGFGDWQKVQHLVLIPNYKEPLHIIERTLDALAKQTFPLANIHIVLACEQREGPSAYEKVDYLEKKYAALFGSFISSHHPVITGEVVGKSSNMAWAAKTAKQEILDKKGLNMNYCTVTSEDVDARFHPQHFAALTYKFLDDPKRYERIWQPAILYYNNIWTIPAPVRVFSTIASITRSPCLTDATV